MSLSGRIATWLLLPLVLLAVLAWLFVHRDDRVPRPGSNRPDLNTVTERAISVGGDEKFPPLMSLDGKWVAYARREATKAGVTSDPKKEIDTGELFVYVTQVGTNRAVKVTGVVCSLSFFWGPSRENPKLIVNRHVVSNEDDCLAFDPRSGKVTDLSIEAGAALNPEKDFGTIYGSSRIRVGRGITRYTHASPFWLEVVGMSTMRNLSLWLWGLGGSLRPSAIGLGLDLPVKAEADGDGATGVKGESSW